MRDRHPYRRTRLTTAGSAAGLLVLDTLMLTAIATVRDRSGWILPTAATPSLTRILTVARTLPTALTT